MGNEEWQMIYGKSFQTTSTPIVVFAQKPSKVRVEASEVRVHELGRTKVVKELLCFSRSCMESAVCARILPA